MDKRIYISDSDDQEIKVTEILSSPDSWIAPEMLRRFSEKNNPTKREYPDEQ